MKLWKTIGAACALGLAIAAPASAQSESWTLARAENGSYSLETTCTQAEVAATAARLNGAFDKLNFAAGTQILCQKDGLLIVAGIVQFGDPPPGFTTYFDKLSDGANKGNGMAGTPEVTTFAGRRALVNRKEKNGFLAQVIVVELSPTRALMVTGAFRDTGLSLAAQGQSLDRLYASVKVAAK